MKKYNFKPLRMFLVAIFGLAFFSLNSCKSTDAEPGVESQIANKEWQTDGVYVDGNKTISPNVRLEFVT